MNKQKQQSKTKLRFSKCIVALMLASVAVFTVAMTIVYICTGGIPDTLVTSFFAFAGGEAGVLGLIKHGETRYNKNESDSSVAG